MAEQPGAKEASVTEQSADRRKQVSCFSSSHTLLPIWNARTHARTRALGKRSADKPRVASVRLQADVSQSQLARLTDHLGRAASDRVSSGDPAEASAPGRERHHGKLTPHSLGPELRFGSVASGCPGQLQTPRCFREAGAAST